MALAFQQPTKATLCQETIKASILRDEEPARPAVQSHLEAILFELEEVRMVGAEQKCAAAGVGVGVADLLGAAALSADRDVHFESLHAHTNRLEEKCLTYIIQY